MSIEVSTSMLVRLVSMLTRGSVMKYSSSQKLFVLMKGTIADDCSPESHVFSILVYCTAVGGST